MLKTNLLYKELGGDYFDLLHPEKAARRLSGRLQRMGYAVTLTRTAPLPQAPWTPLDPSLPRKLRIPHEAERHSGMKVNRIPG
jgi:hypothetical protein